MQTILIITIIILLLVLTGYISLINDRMKIIYGCEARGDAEKPYLSRWTLFSSKKLRLYFHKFHRSDADDLHDHPWNFLSIILWRGYIEETWMYNNTPCIKKRKRIYPGMIIYRKAQHAHRVILVGGKPAYTLVFTFKYIRYWGFYVSDAFWTIYTEYFKQKGC